jgi:predicted transcriptional regulator
LKYRSRTDIIHMILQAVPSNGATKTRIMYAAYLSYAQIKEYLVFLLSKDMLKYDKLTRIYSMTEKSVRFIQAYDRLSAMGVGLDALADHARDQLSAFEVASNKGSF